MLEITSGAVVTGGVVRVDNGIVYIQSGGTANVAFLATGSGGLEIADTQSDPNAYTGEVSGFGGANHANHTQSIDLVSVTSGPGITLSYTPGNAANTSGTLTISSGGHLVASMEMIGTYSAGDFHIKSGISGTVEITDPHIPNGGTVDTQAVSALGAGSSFDLPNLAFGSLQTTLAGPKDNNGIDTSPWLGDPHAVKIGLLASYMAGTFASPIDGHGSTVFPDARQMKGQETLVTTPHTG
jgi:hypothetical protein